MEKRFTIISVLESKYLSSKRKCLKLNIKCDKNNQFNRESVIMNKKITANAVASHIYVFTSDEHLSKSIIIKKCRLFNLFIDF